MPAPTRRQFLQTFAFSAAALLAGRVDLRAVIRADATAAHMLLLGDWGALGDTTAQQKVSRAMAAYGKSQNFSPAAMFFLGDNFYGQFNGGTSSPRWKIQFEDMYPTAQFGCPCYALLGNHDYILEPLGKLEAQLAYAAAHRGTRWTMPSKWYRFDFPAIKPVVTFLALDSNYQLPADGKPSLTSAERAAQTVWLKSELARPRTTPFLVICAHHPIYSNGLHGDNAVLIQEWSDLLRQHSAHLYIAGHDHDLEHLEFAGHPTSFVITGGGGTTVREITEHKSTAFNRFGLGVHGFTHLEVRADRLLVRHFDAKGHQLHAFSKDPQGRVQIL